VRDSDLENCLRILVADDFKPWRDQVRALLKTRPDWEIIGEVSDGLEAVEKATDLQPDIVLLDIGMPSLNGIEAAKIIRQKSPKSRILFITQDGDVDVRNEARQLGDGYLVKANAGNELLDAIATVLHRYKADQST
jgi:DNA-binding NarL/FixJ family response regulator